MRSWRSSTARSERYSFTKPSPTESVSIASTMTASVRSPVASGMRAEQHEQRIVELTTEHAERARAVAADGVRPVAGEA
jgi:hypothetical protein